MDYVIDGSTYSFSYDALREDYHRFKNMSDAEFAASVIDALHFACFVSHLKDFPACVVLSDKGVIHQLVHLLAKDTQSLVFQELVEIRETFNKVLELA